MSKPQPTSGGASRLHSLTSLRFVAAFVVFMHHAAQLLPGQPLRRLTFQGSIGVSFFFVLSGFVLTWSRHPRDTAAKFYRRRFARVWPVHAAAFIVVVALYIRPVHSPIDGGLAAVLSVLLLQAWVPREKFYFGGNAVTWSLSCEVFFYALFPFLIGRIAALSARARVRLAIVLASLPLALAAATPPGPQPLWTWLRYISPPIRLAEFVLGILVALWVKEGCRPRLSLVAAVSLTLSAYLLAGFAPEPFAPVALTLVPICLLIATLARRELDGTAPRVLLHPWARRLGAWSFAFYLVHQVVIASVVTIFERRRGALTEVVIAADVVAFVVALAIAAILHAFVEEPLERRLRGALPLSTP